MCTSPYLAFTHPMETLSRRCKGPVGSILSTPATSKGMMHGTAESKSESEIQVLVKSQNTMELNPSALKTYNSITAVLLKVQIKCEKDLTIDSHRIIAVGMDFWTLSCPTLLQIPNSGWQRKLSRWVLDISREDYTTSQSSLFLSSCLRGHVKNIECIKRYVGQFNREV